MFVDNHSALVRVHHHRLAIFAVAGMLHDVRRPRVHRRLQESAFLESGFTETFDIFIESTFSLRRPMSWGINVKKMLRLMLRGSPRAQLG